MKLGIARKGLIVVAVPLIFELLFVGLLSLALWDNFQKLQSESHAREVLFRLNQIYGCINDAATALATYKSSHDASLLNKYDEAVERTKLNVSKLKEIVSSKHGSMHEKERKREIYLVEKVELATEKSAVLLEECKQNLMSGNQFVALGSMPVLFKIAEKVREWTDELGGKYKKVDEKASRAQLHRSINILYVVLAGTVVNLLVGFGLGRYFGSTISNRVLVLADNSERLAKGEPLNPPVEGDDEIHILDMSFRKMSEDLKLAQDEQKLLTANAIASEERTRSVIENMPIGIIIIDQQSKIESLNPRAEQMFGGETEKLLGHPLSTLLPESQPAELSKTTNEIRKGAPQSFLPLGADANARRINGENFPAEINLSKFSTQDGKHYLVTVQDVTERHEMEKLKREFVSMVSHDLRTPLTAVQGTLDLLDEDTYGELTANGHKRVKTASESVDRLISLINDLLDIEKMEAGKMRLEPKPTSLQKIVSSSIESVRTFAEQHEVELEMKLDEDLLVMADRDRIIQVVINLLSNAVKFSPAGSRVTVSCSNRDSQSALVQVIDRGRGIPQEHVDSLFQRFKQVKAADGARKKGTGLGLAICKAIIESHGGKIGVTSEDGVGSTFFFLVPLAKFSS